MNSIVSIVIFLISMLFYIHIRHYHVISSERDIIYLDLNILNLNRESINILLEDACRAKLPCVFINTQNVNTNYTTFLMILDKLKLNVPLSYVDNMGDNNIFLTIEAVEFMDNEISVDDQALVFDKNTCGNNSLMTDEQKNRLETVYSIAKQYSSAYLFNQYITQYNEYLYFSNYETASYLPFQYFKNPLNVFYVLDGMCDISIIHPDFVDMRSVVDDYVFFRFYIKGIKRDIKSCVSDENEKHINKYVCKKGDMILIPNKWFVSIKMEKQTVLLRESVSTTTSVISLAPEYIKHLLYRSTIKIVKNKLSEVNNNTIEEQPLIEHDSEQVEDKNDGNVQTNEIEYENEVVTSDDTVKDSITTNIISANSISND
jgi:hypothetical protein